MAVMVLRWIAAGIAVLLAVGALTCFALYIAFEARTALERAKQLGAWIRLLALAVILDFEFLIIDAGILLELLGAPIGAFIKTLVVFAADIIDDRGLHVPAPRPAICPDRCRRGNHRPECAP